MERAEEKFIYRIAENKYRIRFLRINPKTKERVYFHQFYECDLNEAIRIRDAKLKEYGVSLDKPEKIDIFEKKEPVKKTKKVYKQSASSSCKNRIDKYIYEIEAGKKYRIFIRKGSTKGNKGDYFSKVIEGNITKARKLRDDKLAEMRLNKNSSKDDILFIDFCKIYYKEYAEKELSPTTVSTGKQELRNYVFPEIAYMPLKKIDALVIQKIINKLRDRYKERKNDKGEQVKLSMSTVNNVYRLLRKILNKAVAWGFIDSNPVLKVKAPGNSKVEKKSFNREELIEVLELLKKEDIVTECLFTIAICSGLRRGELVGLHLNDINFVNNTISVNRTVVWDERISTSIEKETKTKGSVRVVPVPLFCMEVIKEYLKLRERMVIRFKKTIKNYKEINNLFLNKYGKIMGSDTASGKWGDFRRRHPNLKKVSLHGLRHSYCSMQMNENSGLSPADVQKLMGHSQLSTTYIYTHSNEDKNDAAISVFDKYYNSNHEKKINFNEMLSLYTNQLFVPKSKYMELINFCIPEDISIIEKLKRIHEYINNKYDFFSKINIDIVNVSNIFDWLEEQKNIYGNEFIITNLS